MATIERDVVLTTKTADGGTAIDLPITRLGNIEHTSADKTELVDDDLLPLFDSKDRHEAKKISFADLITSAKSKLGSVYAALAHTHKVDDVTGLSTQLSNKVQGTTTIYTTLEALDLAPGAETIESIAKKMLNGSRLVLRVEASNNLAIYPEKAPGLLMIEKAIENRMSLLYQIGINTDARLYCGSYYGSGSKPGFGGWKRLATAELPQEYDLPLASGVSKYDGGGKYAKSQDGIVTVVCSATIADGSDAQCIAYVPAGYRPKIRIYLAASTQAAGTRSTALVKIDPTGEIIYHGVPTGTFRVFFSGSFLVSP